MAKKILVYSTETCPHCHALKAWLKEKKLEFTNYDVGEDSKKAKEMVDKSGQSGVPVIDIDGKIIVGFDQEKLEEVLG